MRILESLHQKKIIKSLSGKLKKIDVSEPYLKNKDSNISDDYNFLNKFNVNNVTLSKATIKKYDVVLILSDHDCFNYNLLKKESRILIDTRNRVKRKNNFYKL